eukprot:14663716-Alexandrium_andersonii.AAC.1
MLTPARPGDPKPCYGVGLLVNRKWHACEPAPRSHTFMQYVQEGRLHLALVTLGARLPTIVISFYAYATSPAGADMGTVQATGVMFEAIFDELSKWPVMPFVLLGDLSTQPNMVPALRTAILGGNVIDAGAIASVWGGCSNQPTARAHNAKTMSRLDYVFVSSDLHWATIAHE